MVALAWLYFWQWADVGVYVADCAGVAAGGLLAQAKKSVRSLV
jgi:hypothetical protein